MCLFTSSVGVHLIHAKQPRAKRYSFVAPVELTHVESSALLREKTTDLSLFGCHIAAQNPWPTGTKVRIRISHGGVWFAALGTVAHVQSGAGMGIVFTRIGPNEQVLLDRWIAGLRDQ